MILGMAVGWVGCGQSFRDRLRQVSNGSSQAWQLISVKCNGVANTTFANALAGGATYSLLVDESTYRRTLATTTCSHVYQGIYITLPGETGVSFQDQGTVGCTPSGCSLAAEFNESEAVCGTSVSGATTPLVAFRDEGNTHYLDLTYNATDCNGDGTNSDTRIETYKH